MRLRIGLVTTWFGPDLKGGAEQQCWNLVTRLAERGHNVTVITTVARSFHHSWDTPYHAEGLTEMAPNLSVRRFRLNKRNGRTFNRVVDKWLSTPLARLRMSLEDEDNYLRNNIGSDAALEYLSKNQDTFDAVIFMPYLFPLAILGVPLLGAKAVVQPCLHDEAYAYLPAVRRMMQSAGKIFFNSRGEELLFTKIYGSDFAKGFVVSEGIEAFSLAENVGSPPSDFPAEYTLGQTNYKPYFLYLGKRCKEKNTDLLVAAFDRFLKTSTQEARLVLAGSDDLPLRPLSSEIRDVGKVSEETKHFLLANAFAIVNFSVNESFSRLLFEGWAYRKPALVHAHCLATATAVDEAGGGWKADSLSSASRLFNTVLASPSTEISRSGEAGFHYAQKHASWDEVILRYEGNLL